MKIEASKRNLIAFILPIVTALLTGGVIGEQFQYLHTFYSKHMAHWSVCLAIFSVSFLYSYWKSKSSLYENFILVITFLAIAFYGFKSILKLHEHSHLAYLLSYVLMGFLGRTAAGYKQIFHSKAILSASFLICVGFAWRYYLIQNEAYHYLLLIAVILFAYEFSTNKNIVKAVFTVVTLVFFIGIKLNTSPAEIFKSQANYTDRIIFSEQTAYHQIDITSWRGNHWFYYDGKVQFSSVDEALYSEAMVHPMMLMLKNKKKVLVIGGENGIILKEILKYDSVQSIDILVLDTALYEMTKSNALFTKVNQHSLNSKKIIPTSTTSIKDKTDYYNAIFIDAPDPSNNKWNTYYTHEFYKICRTILSENGMMITQAGNPYLNSKAFASIEKTLQSVNLHTLPIHNQILTLGEWGWVIASKSSAPETLKAQIVNSKEVGFDNNTWVNKEALQMLASFGKKTTSLEDVKVNSNESPVLIEYYKKGDFTFE